MLLECCPMGKEQIPRANIIRNGIIGSVEKSDEMMKKQNENWNCTRMLLFKYWIQLPPRKGHIWIGSKGFQKNWNIFLPVVDYCLLTQLLSAQNSKMWIVTFVINTSPNYLQVSAREQCVIEN